jgi:hypothetical protein
MATITIIRTHDNKTFGAYKARPWSDLDNKAETEHVFDYLFYIDGEDIIKLPPTALPTKTRQEEEEGEHILANFRDTLILSESCHDNENSLFDVSMKKGMFSDVRTATIEQAMLKVLGTNKMTFKCNEVLVYKVQKKPCQEGYTYNMPKLAPEGEVCTREVRHAIYGEDNWVDFFNGFRKKDPNYLIR